MLRARQSRLLAWNSRRLELAASRWSNTASAPATRRPTTRPKNSANAATALSRRYHSRRKRMVHGMGGYFARPPPRRRGQSAGPSRAKYVLFQFPALDETNPALSRAPSGKGPKRTRSPVSTLVTPTRIFEQASRITPRDENSRSAAPLRGGAAKKITPR